MTEEHVSFVTWTICAELSVAARNLEKIRQQENDFPVQGFFLFVFLFSFFFSAEKFKTPASGSGNIIKLQTG